MPLEAARHPLHLRVRARQELVQDVRGDGGRDPLPAVDAYERSQESVTTALLAEWGVSHVCPQPRLTALQEDNG